MLDCDSVVRHIHFYWEVPWPYDGMQDVPRSFCPELPNPFPGQDQSKWGYPITLQLGFLKNGTVPEIEITLRRGGSKGEIVPSLVSTPQKPGNEKLVPPLAWCLIPKEHLRAKTKYHVTAKIRNPAKTLSWSFKTGSGR